MRKLILLNVLAAVCVMWTGKALATHSPVTENDMFNSLPVVSSVSRISQATNKAPASVTIIDQELITASGAQNWVDVFRLVPGFQSYAINANRPGIDYHGIGVEFPRQLEVTVDGRSVYQPLFSTVEWSVLNVAIEDIEYIEVIRGSNAASQGSNAFKGAINIVTQKPHLNNSAHMRVSAGSRDSQRVSLSKNGYAGALDYQFNFGFERNDGFPSVSGQPDPEDNGKLADGRDLVTTDFRGIYAPNLQDTFDFNVGYSHNHSGWGDGDHPSEYTVAEWDSSFQSLRWNRLTDTGNELNLQFYHNYFTAENNVTPLLSELFSSLLETEISPELVPVVLSSVGAPPLEDQRYNLGFGNLSAHRYDMEFEYKLQPTNKLKFAWGFGLRHEDLKAMALLDTEKELSSNSQRAFSSAEWSLSKLFTLNLGGMVEHNDIVETISSSRISLNFHPTPHQGFRVSFAHGERSPSVLESNERNLSRFDNAVWEIIRVSEPDIGEERINTYEIAYMANFEQVSFDIKLFREENRDLITDRSDYAINQPTLLPEDYFLIPGLDKIKTNDNFLDLDLIGTEMQLRYYPNPRALVAFHYTYLDMEGGLIDPTRPLRPVRQYGARVPSHTFSVLARYQFGSKLSGSIWAYHMNEADWEDGNFIDEYTRIDAQLRYTFLDSRKYSGALSLIGQNLGEDYSEFSRNNVFQTRVYLKLELGFH